MLTAEKEAQELRLQNSTLTRRGQHQREEIQRLNKVRLLLLQTQTVLHVRHTSVLEGHNSSNDVLVQALEEALQTSQPLGGSSETLQDIWKHQVSFHQQRPLEFWGNFLKRTPKTFQDVEKKKPVNPSGAT